MRRARDADDVWRRRRARDLAEHADLTAAQGELAAALRSADAARVPLLLAGDWNCKFHAAATACVDEGSIPPALAAVFGDSEKGARRIPFVGEAIGPVPPTFVRTVMSRV